VIQSKSQRQLLNTNLFRKARNTSGQGLVEYLILTALLAVATMGVVRLLGHSVSAKYADVVNAVQGETARKTELQKVDENHYRKRDMSDFLRGSVQQGDKND
jgi:Flp pilus assembly pilin Flp